MKRSTIESYKAASFFFIQRYVCELKPTGTDIDDLKVFPFFTQSLLEGLKAELPLYLLKSDGVSTEMTKLQWWQSHEEELPRWWSNACKQVVLIQLSSAAAEESFLYLLTHPMKDKTVIWGLLRKPQLCCNITLNY